MRTGFLQGQYCNVRHPGTRETHVDTIKKLRREVESLTGKSESRERRFERIAQIIRDVEQRAAANPDHPTIADEVTLEEMLAIYSAATRTGQGRPPKKRA
jgi:hypothetical protein